MADAKIFDVTINDVSTREVEEHIRQRVQENSQGYIATINTEFLMLSRQNPQFKTALAQADLRLCDGVGVQWAANFTRNHHSRAVNLLHFPLSALRLMVQPKSAQRTIKHRLAGRLLFEDLLGYCAKHGYSVFFLGGGPDVAKQVAERAKSLHPKLKVAGYYAGNPEDAQEILEMMPPSQVLFVAYGPPRQEIFIHQHLDQLQTNVAIAVGGTFDYFVGAKPIGSAFKQRKPPKWLHQLGLEWLWRLITQPTRLKRVWRSVVTFSLSVALSPSKND